jgi:rhodanese-related sulfurtransferase
MVTRSAQNRISKIVKIALFLSACLVNSVSGQSVFVGKSGAQGKALKQFIEPAELKKIVDNPVDSIWIVDVRSEKAYQNGHIPTAKSFPAGTIAERLNEIPKDKYLIMYCTVGGTVKVVAQKLKKAGYKRYINWGGLSRWEWEKESEKSIPEKQ